MITFGSLFAGIGGFDLGFERAGMMCRWQVEKDPDALRVLQKHWPTTHRIEDVHNAGRKNLEPVRVICGGFPCQPFSIAGKKRGEHDSRNLWPEMYRIVKELKPRWVVGENVFHITYSYLDTVLNDLEVENYTARAFVLPASAFGLPHRRYRVFIVAYADCLGLEEIEIKNYQYAEERRKTEEEGRWPFRLHRTHSGETFAIPYPRGRRGLDGVSSRMDTSRIARYRLIGNAVVPQAAEHIGRVIINVERMLEERTSGE